MNQLASQIESILFVSSKPMTLKQLVKFTGSTEEAVVIALQELSEYKANSGVVLLDTGSEYQLATHSANSNIVKDFLNSDLRESLTDATTEVLAIIAYRQPITKAEIESIRGVNSQYSIRALLMRGLIEKVSNPQDSRSSLYQITTEFLQQLGLTSIRDLPNFEDLVKNIKLPDAPAVADSSMQDDTDTSSNSADTLNEVETFANQNFEEQPSEQSQDQEPINIVELSPEEIVEIMDEDDDEKMV